MIFGLSPTGDLAYRRLALADQRPKIWPIGDLKIGLSATESLAYPRPETRPIID